MLAEKVKYVERVKSGLIHTAEHEMKKPITGHLDDFEKSLKSRSAMLLYEIRRRNIVRRCRLCRVGIRRNFRRQWFPNNSIISRFSDNLPIQYVEVKACF